MKKNNLLVIFIAISVVSLYLIISAMMTHFEDVFLSAVNGEISDAISINNDLNSASKGVLTDWRFYIPTSFYIAVCIVFLIFQKRKNSRVERRRGNVG